MNTENLKREMYDQLETLKRQKKLTGCLGVFEERLEAYLEALRQEYAERCVEVDHYSRMRDVFSDAYERQKTLTRNALVLNRELHDELYQLRSDLKSAEHDREEWHDKRQEATAKLASQTQTIIALHTAIKDLQASLATSQELLRKTETALGDLAVQSHREIKKAEATAEERYDLLEKRQKTIVKQRKAIESLTFELISERKLAQKPRFKWRFWQKSPKAKALTK